MKLLLENWKQYIAEDMPEDCPEPTQNSTLNDENKFKAAKDKEIAIIPEEMAMIPVEMAIIPLEMVLLNLFPQQ